MTPTPAAVLPPGAAAPAPVPAPAAWEIDRARFAYGARELFRDVTWTMRAGEFWALLGPNAVGKTTLIHAMLGFLPLAAGEVRHAGRAVGAWDRRAFARRVALLPQREEHAFPLAAREVVALGRAPHARGWSLGWSAEDLAAAEAALARVGMTALADAPFGRLSGGERQLVLMARCLAQEPAALLLDEPTASLDPAHQMQLLGLARGLADAGRAVAMVVHDVNHAARWADHVALLAEGRLVAAGPAAEVLAPERLSAVYGVRFERVEGPGGRPLFVAA